MPDPREEAVAPKLQALIGSYRWTDVGLKRAAAQLLAAADAVDPMRRRKSGSHRLTDPAELRARLADVEHDAATSAAAVARLYELLANAVVRAETAEADRDTLMEALEKIRDAPQPESGWRIARAALAAVKGREEQVCPNCEGKGHEGTGLLEDDYPCRTCMGAKTVKRQEDA